jgi:PST family polysaccharide transporter
MSDRNMILGTAAMAAGNAVRLLLQLLAIPVVARFLGPSAYGVVALASPFFFFLLLFGDFGLGPALVREPSLSRVKESSAFWTILAIGSCLALVLTAIAYPVGALLAQPEITPILVGFAPIFILAAVGVVPSARLQRGGRFRTVALIETVAACGGICAAIVAALGGWGPWALVAQQWVFWAVKIAAILVATRFYPILAFDGQSVRRSLHFGSALVGSGVAHFLGTNLDNLLIGSILGTEKLGLYAIAYQIVNIPSMILGAAHYSLLPAMSAAHQKKMPLDKTYLEALRVMLLVAAPALAGLACIADLLLALFFGEGWSGSAVLICLLAPLGLVATVLVLNAAVLLSIGRSGIEFQNTLIRSAAAVAGICAGIFWGPEGVAFGVSAAAILTGLMYMRAVFPIAGISARGAVDAASVPLTASAAMTASVLLARWTLLNGLPVAAALLLSIALGVASYLAALFFLSPEKFSADLSTVRGLIAKRAEV